jgi:hypothetical protein
MIFLFAYWFLGVFLGFGILLARTIHDAPGAPMPYWYLFTVLWPLGLLVFILWAIIQTYRLVIHITSQQ